MLLWCNMDVHKPRGRNRRSQFNRWVTSPKILSDAETSADEEDNLDHDIGQTNESGDTNAPPLNIKLARGLKHLLQHYSTASITSLVSTKEENIVIISLLLKLFTLRTYPFSRFVLTKVILLVHMPPLQQQMALKQT